MNKAIINVTKPQASQEELMAVIQALNSTNKNSETNKVISEFNYKYFGEIMSGYCDQNCIDRTRRRILDLQTTIIS